MLESINSPSSSSSSWKVGRLGGIVVASVWRCDPSLIPLYLIDWTRVWQPDVLVE